MSGWRRRTENHTHICWPAKWSPDSSRLFIWQDVLSGSMRADGIGTAVYDTVSGTMIDSLGEQEEVVLPIMKMWCLERTIPCFFLRVREGKWR